MMLIGGAASLFRCRGVFLWLSIAARSARALSAPAVPIILGAQQTLKPQVHQRVHRCVVLVHAVEQTEGKGA